MNPAARPANQRHRSASAGFPSLRANAASASRNGGVPAAGPWAMSVASPTSNRSTGRGLDASGAASAADATCRVSPAPARRPVNDAAIGDERDPRSQDLGLSLLEAIERADLGLIEECDGVVRRPSQVLGLSG